MSYGLTIAGDARADLRSLEPWLQEDLLDELDILADDPSPLPASAPGGDLVYAFRRHGGGANHYLFVTLSRNDATEMLTVLGISYRKLTLPPP